MAFNVESREYNERWYTDLKAWKIDTGSGNTSNSNSANNSSPKKQNATGSQNGDVTTFHTDAEDDLPF